VAIELQCDRSPRCGQFGQSKASRRLPYLCRAISKLTLAMLLGRAGPEGPTSAAVNLVFRRRRNAHRRLASPHQTISIRRRRLSLVRIVQPKYADHNAILLILSFGNFGLNVLRTYIATMIRSAAHYNNRPNLINEVKSVLHRLCFCLINSSNGALI
jgi:hypothetical protein